MKKKVDPRIRQTLEDAVANNHRALVFLVGDKARDQVVNLHYMLSKLTLGPRPTVLWCYKHELGFSSNKKKRMKLIKKRIRQGLVDPQKDDPFELFVSATTIRFAYYSDSHKVLGNTYGMCVLQDFEALTPNLLARTLETVQGGGLVTILVQSMSSLKQLFALTMDVHARLRTEAHTHVVPRFNERFILSLADCPAAIVADDELNVLPISSRVRALTGRTSLQSPGALPSASAAVAPSTADAPELVDLKKSLEDTPPIGPLITKARTIDQAKALLRFEEALSEKTLRTTVALTAARGRGKSAALGLAVAAAVAHDYSNIFVTSPSPENLRTFFAFLFVGFDALEYAEHVDYEIIQSNDPSMAKAVVRVNIFKAHRQTIQYIDPSDAHRFLSQAELLVIDEAAAIPLPVVEGMLGPYVVFISSTITGYEGTGRSLSLKLLKKLRDNSASASAGSKALANGSGNRETDRQAVAVAAGSGSGRVFREVTLECPIRYAQGDPIEAWLYDLLCLRAGGERQPLTTGAPHPRECQLFYVERDALFSRHRASEMFLQRIVALFVASHYKNSPNDLQMLSDAPAHGLFVLLAPTGKDADAVPDVLVAIQVCLEGRISSGSSKAQMSRGMRANGDLIPWTVSQQFQEPEFATLSGVRIVRVATHPDLQGMGYGSRAVSLLLDYFAGKMISLDNRNEGGEEEEEDGEKEKADEGGTTNGQKGSALLDEVIGPRKNIPPLLRRLEERKCERLDYVGVSYGVTSALFNFWNRLGFLPVYVRLTANDLTGEHTCIMVRSTGREEENEEDDGAEWVGKFHQDFRRRLVMLLGYDLRGFECRLGMGMLRQGEEFWETRLGKEVRVGRQELEKAFNQYDRRRLETYGRNLVDYHVIMDLVPRLGELYMLGAFEGEGVEEERARLSAAQCAILVAMGLQRKNVEAVSKELGIESGQVLALLNKVVRKFAKWLRAREEGEAAKEIGNGLKGDGAEEGETGGSGGALERFSIGGGEKEWSAALGDADADLSGVVSVKGTKRSGGEAGEAREKVEERKKGKKKRRKV